jgi:hypothetical protein
VIGPRSRARAALAALLAASLAACEERAPERAAAPQATGTSLAERSPTSPSSATTAGAPATAAGSGAPGDGAAALEILRFTLTSGVRDKEPVDKLTSAAPGQRVWAHVTIRNRTPTKRGIQLVFRVDGDVRTTVDLDVERSWSYRTWGYNTLKPGDTGELEVEVVDEREQVIAEAQLPIRRATK